MATSLARITERHASASRSGALGPRCVFKPLFLFVFSNFSFPSEYRALPRGVFIHDNCGSRAASAGFHDDLAPKDS
ncbi:unnamed protein product [Periconia digitata]|uniref:Uncharacterized protein n=1 Tax=Periconia digitata TaxID=1303443 RepID=A0A9W4UUB3_9PLEO|nr:unnamed protein product [Periconia digitata]